MLSDKYFLILIILTILITLTLLFIVAYYTAETSAPSMLHSTFTTSKGPTTVTIQNNKTLSQSSHSNSEFVYESSLTLVNNFIYNSNTSWSLWQLVRLTAHLSGKNQSVDLPDYLPSENIMGMDRNLRPKKMGMLYHNPTLNITVLAFSGTSNPADWRTDMDFNLVNNTLSTLENNEKIHQGFLRRYNYMEPEIKRLINKYNTRTDAYGWFITGHSLGGAVATLVAYDQKNYFSSTPHIYTFGQPRVGNSDFASTLNKMYPGAHRVTNNNDVITFLPPPVWFRGILYEHAFKEYQFAMNLGKYSKNHIEAYQLFLDPAS